MSDLTYRSFTPAAPVLLSQFGFFCYSSWVFSKQPNGLPAMVFSGGG
jgi:hypothetical protein